jgi:D-alanine-D-alanine ligase
MRSLSLGVLVSADARLSAGAGSPHGTPERPSRTLDAQFDLPSAADLLESLTGMGHRARLIHADDDLDLSLRNTDVDACVLALHGTVGGTGDVQALLGMRGIPFTGAASSAVSLAFDKVRSRQLLAYNNLPVPTAVALGPDRDVGERALGLLGWPCVVKPRHGAHGVGVTHLQHSGAVADAVERALSVDHELVLERAVAGAEVQVVLLGTRVIGSMQVERSMAPDRMSSGMMCPPQMGRVQLEGIHSLARSSVSALGLEESVTRVDILVSPRQNEIILEVEPLPPLHRDGVVARVTRAHGISHEALVSELLERISLGTPHHERGMTYASSAELLQ